MTKSMFCGALLILLARHRTPQVVLLTEQTDPLQNGVYEVLPCEPATTLVRVGDPAKVARVVRLGAGWAVADVPDEHGFFPVVQVIDRRVTDGFAGLMAAFDGDRWPEWARRHGKKVAT